MPKITFPTPLQIGEILDVNDDGQWRSLKVAVIGHGHNPTPPGRLDPYVSVGFEDNPHLAVINYTLYCQQGWIRRQDHCPKTAT